MRRLLPYYPVKSGLRSKNPNTQRFNCDQNMCHVSCQAQRKIDISR